MTVPLAERAQFIRRVRLDTDKVPFTVNGTLCHGRKGDTVLTALLTLYGHVRQTEFSGENRAGFCLIGACQDCIVRTEQGEPLRACTTALQSGMAFVIAGAIAGDSHE